MYCILYNDAPLGTVDSIEEARKITNRLNSISLHGNNAYYVSISPISTKAIDDLYDRIKEQWDAHWTKKTEDLKQFMKDHP